MANERNDKSDPITNLFGEGVLLTPEQTRAMIRLALEWDPELAELFPFLEDGEAEPDREVSAVSEGSTGERQERDSGTTQS